MSTDTSPVPVGPPAAVHVMVDRALLRALDHIRLAIQVDACLPQALTRADIVRLALRRLVLNYLTHLSEMTNPPADLLERWRYQCDLIKRDGACPPWLMPGSELCLLHAGNNKKTPKTPKTPREK